MDEKKTFSTVKPTPVEVWGSATRYCPNCKRDIDVNNYGVRRDGKRWRLTSYCKTCKSDLDRKYQLEHVDEKRAYLKEWATKNAEKKKIARDKWYQDNREHCGNLSRKWLANNRARRRVNVNAWTKMKRDTDPHFAMAARLRHRLNMALRTAKAIKSNPTMELVGCDKSFLMAHLQSTFKSGMTWENRGEWHIDHIRPCALFDLTKPEEQAKCFHWSNLQALWKSENLKKWKRFG